MANKNDIKPTLPPYLPFKTFQSFVQRLHETTLPPRIDSSLLRSYSGSVQSQVRGSLRFLGLIDEADATTQKFREVVAAYSTPDWQKIIGQVISEAYSLLTDGLELGTATRQMLEERFTAWGGTEGDVLRKCLAFYVAACAAGGITLSPHIIAERRGRPLQPRGRSRRQREEPKPGEASDNLSVVQPGIIRFTLPLPSNPKATATISVAEGITVEDWTMIDATMQAYIERRKKS